jgi:hypothetical protein
MTLHWHEEARELRAAGEMQRVIADHFGVSQARVSQVTNGVVCPVNHRARPRADKWGSAADAFILERYGEWSASKIGKRLGVSRNAIIGRVWRLRQRATLQSREDA